MLTGYKLKISYKIDNDVINSSTLENEHYSVRTNKASQESLTLTVIPKAPIELRGISLKYNYKFSDNSKVFPNGYQSWTYCKEYGKRDKLKGLMPIGKLAYKFTSIFGDYQFKNYPKKAGVFHGYTYSYIREGEEVYLLGSLSERQGYTIFNFDMNNDTVIIEKETEGLTISEEYKAFDLVFYKGAYNKVFDKYFKHYDKPRINNLSGYTSWYNYFGKISEEILLRDLNGLDKIKGYAGIFQIDDGYQSKVGDWLKVKEDKFPNGMKYIADAVHSKGMMAGIWLAPFICARSSKLANEHPEWLVRDAKNKPVLGNIGWGGAYIIDFYIKEARDYIKNFFNVILNDWGFDMVKLDFLYSVCLNPRYNKTRGTIMCEAMDFLRECVGDKYILGCGVPLGPAFNKVDMCRISCDVDLSYRNKPYYYVGNREIVNTRSAINNTIMRRHLDGRIFCNDPDVFFLRKNNLSFTLEQKLLLAKVNNMFGNVLFVSDNVGDYDIDQLEEIKKSFVKNKAEVISAEYMDKDNIRIIYTENRQKYQWDIDIITGSNSVMVLD